MSLHLGWVVWHVIICLLGQIFPPSDSRSILNWSILLVFIAEFKTASIGVLAAAIALDFLLTRGPLVCHGHVVLPVNVAPDR